MWPAPPDAAHLERLLAELDVDGPTAIEDRDDGARVFFATADRRQRAARRLAMLDRSVRCALVDIPGDDWAERSQADLGPITIGRFIITPRLPASADRSADLIAIRPSMGFGTGHHASTRLCLALLQRTPTAGRRVLDIGTGSGVLAIAAARLGAALAVGVDPDPDALASAQENVEVNGVGPVVTLVSADLRLSAAIPGAPFDVVLANLTSALLVAEAATLGRLVGPGGDLIASGFTTDDADSVIQAFATGGLALDDRREDHEWVGLVLRLDPDRPPSGG